MDRQIKEFISIPLAIATLKHDRPLFKNRSMANVYLSKIDHVINQMEDDFNQLRGKYYSRVRRLNGSYIVDNRSYTFTADQLKGMTIEVTKKYMTGNKATPFEVDNTRLYKDLNN